MRGLEIRTGDPVAPSVPPFEGPRAPPLRPGRATRENQPAASAPPPTGRLSAGTPRGERRPGPGNQPCAQKPVRLSPGRFFHRSPPSWVPCSRNLKFLMLSRNTLSVPPSPTMTADPRKCSVCFAQPFGDRKLGKSPGPEMQSLRRGLRSKDTDFGGPMCAKRK